MSVPYRKVMVTLDGSDFAAQALPHAQSLARKYDTELILFQVIPELDQSLLETWALDLAGLHEGSTLQRKQAVAAASRPIQALAERLVAEGIRAKAVVEVGRPAHAIINYASIHDIDLIVMSTHGRTGVDRWVYGSVAEKVLRTAGCPVLLVRVLVH